MTRVNPEQTRLMPWYAKAGAASSIVPLSRWVGPNIFALKTGGYGVVASLTGMDEESLSDQEIESRTRAVLGALRGLPEGSCLYQYSRVLSGYEIPRKPTYGDPVLDSFVDDRLEFLNANAGFRRIDLHWVLTIEPDQKNPLDRKPKDAAAANTRRLATLRKTASILETQLASVIGLRVLNKAEAFPFFSYLFNLEPWADHAKLKGDSGLGCIDILCEPSPCTCDGYGGVEVLLELVEPCAEPSELLEVGEGSLDAVTCAIERPVEVALFQTPPGGRDDGLDAVAGKVFQDVVHVIALVCQHGAGREIGKQGDGLRAIVALAAGQQEAQRAA